VAIYAVWNNKGGVGKSYLTYQIASEYARTHPGEWILVVDMCPQADSSSMLLGGMENGERQLEVICGASPRMTIAGYIRERINSPYLDPHVGVGSFGCGTFDHTILGRWFIQAGGSHPACASLRHHQALRRRAV
jgi:chromosome partitioning protein